MGDGDRAEADHVRHADAGAGLLPLAVLAAQLTGELVHLPEAGRPQRMPLPDTPAQGPGDAVRAGAQASAAARIIVLPRFPPCIMSI